jgi:hypothetical protein
MTYRGGASWYNAHANIYCFHYEVYEMIDSVRVLGNYCKKTRYKSSQLLGYVQVRIQDLEGSLGCPGSDVY